MNEKFQSVAHDYARLIGEIAVADRKAQKARSELENLKATRERLAATLGEFVGANVRRKSAVTAGSLVVTVEYVSDNCLPTIHVYEDGEEIVA